MHGFIESVCNLNHPKKKDKGSKANASKISRCAAANNNEVNIKVAVGLKRNPDILHNRRLKRNSSITGTSRTKLNIATRWIMPTPSPKNSFRISDESGGANSKNFIKEVNNIAETTLSELPPAIAIGYFHFIILPFFIYLTF